jgi:hypothetical protein
MSDDKTMETAAPSALPSRRFEGREDFQQLVRDALATAAREGWREIVLSDASFDDWPLYERVVAESLNSWSATGRKMTLLAKNWDNVIRRQARFVTWRRTWMHIIDARACPSADALDLPSAIWSPAWALERRDLDHCVGFCGGEPERRVALKQVLHEWLQKSTPSFPATTTGL